MFLFFFLMLAISNRLAGAMKSSDKKGDETRGVVLLDATTFPKIIPSDRHATVVMFSNKAKFQDPETDVAREEYLEVAVTGDKGEIRDLLFAQVIVNGAYNSMLAGRVGFENGAKTPGIAIYEIGSSTPIIYPHARINAHLLRKFLSKYSGFYYPMPNTIPKMSVIVQRLMQTTTVEEMNPVIADAKEFAKNVEPSAKEVCDYYVKVMEKVQDKGWEWAETEYLRLAAVLESGSVTVPTSVIKLEMKKAVVSEFDRDFKMNPEREKFVPKATRKKIAAAEAKAAAEAEREASKDGTIDVAGLKDSIKADL